MDLSVGVCSEKSSFGVYKVHEGRFSIEKSTVKPAVDISYHCP
jgi:hypothetical protein